MTQSTVPLERNRVLHRSSAGRADLRRNEPPRVELVEQRRGEASVKTGRYQSSRAHGPHKEFGVYPKYRKSN